MANEPGEHTLRYKTHFEKTFYRISQAFDHARLGKIKHAKSALAQARVHSNDHINELKTQNKHDEIADYIPRIDRYFKRAEGIINEAASKSGKRYAKIPKVAKPFKKSELEKAMPVTPIAKSPGLNPRYDYKHYSQLTPDNQKAANHAFQNKDMDQYHYATHPKTGEFVFTGRAKLPNPALKEGVTQNPGLQHGNQHNMAPEHRPGATVRIDAQGTEHHGRMGLVRQANPNVPGKLKVQIGGTHDIAYVEPHQVRLNKSDLEDTVSRSRAVLADIRKKK